jgi:hypothetical protein
VEKEEIIKYYTSMTEDERLQTLVSNSEAFTAIQNEADKCIVSDSVETESKVWKVLERISVLAMHRFEIRSDEEIANAKGE